MVICGRDKPSNTSHSWNTYQTEHLDLSNKRLTKCFCLFWLAVKQYGVAVSKFCLNCTQLCFKSPWQPAFTCWSVFEQDADSSAAPGQLCTCWPELTWKGRTEKRISLQGMKGKQQLGIWTFFGQSLPHRPLILTQLLDKIMGTPHDNLTNTVVKVRHTTSKILARDKHFWYASFQSTTAWESQVAKRIGLTVWHDNQKFFNKLSIDNM